MSSKDSQQITRPSIGWRPKGHNLRLGCNKLRIDPNDGCTVEEYRIESGSVERRILSAPGCPSLDSPWRRLTAEQLSSHVMASTAVAHWLLRRMGIQALIRACNQHLLSVSDAGQRLRMASSV